MAPWAARWTWLRAAGFRLLRPLVVLFALGPIGVYLVLGIIHLRYPFEIEWMEGGIVDVVRRVVAGQKIYVKPTVDFVPYIYAPLYFYVAGAFAKVLGVGFFSARLVSFLASLGVIALVFRFVQRDTKSLFAAVAAAGLFAATYRIATGFYDIARVDSLFVVLLLGALYPLRFHTSARSRVVAAVLFTLAFLTKQSASLIFVPIALHVVLAERKRALVFVGTAAGLMLASVLVLDRIHSGWFAYFVFWLPRQHAWVRRMWWDFWIEDLMAPLAPGCLVGLFYLITQKGAPGRRFYFLAFAGTLAVAWTGRLHTGGWPNVIMPAFAMIAILFGLGLHAGLARAAELAEDGRLRAEVFLLVTAFIQFGCLVYDPSRYIPTKRDQDAGNELLASIQRLDGDVFLPAHGSFTALVGKRTFAQSMAIGDILGVGGGRPGAELRDDIRRAIAQKRFGAIVLDDEWFRREIDQAYVKKEDLFAGKDVFWPVTGARMRPRMIFVPR